MHAVGGRTWRKRKTISPTPESSLLSQPHGQTCSDVFLHRWALRVVELHTTAPSRDKALRLACVMRASVLCSFPLLSRAFGLFMLAFSLFHIWVVGLLCALLRKSYGFRTTFSPGLCLAYLFSSWNIDKNNFWFDKVWCVKKNFFSLP